MTKASNNNDLKSSLSSEIHSYFLENNIRPGAILPTERELARVLGRGRSQVRTAYRQLENEGVIYSISPRKRVLKENSQTSSTAFMSKTIVLITSATSTGINLGISGQQEQRITTAIFQAAFSAGLTILLHAPDSLDKESLDHLISARPIGVIGLTTKLTTSTGLLYLERLREAGIPVVMQGDVLLYSALPFMKIDHVQSNHEAGARQLVEWLVKQKRRRILFFAPESFRNDLAWCVQRRKGYLDTVAELGLTPYETEQIENTYFGPITKTQFIKKVESYKKVLSTYLTAPEPIDAIMLLSDGSYCEVAAACRSLNKEPGKDVLIAGYDNYWRVNENRCFEHTSPSATIDKDIDIVGQKLVQIIRDRGAGNLPDTVQSVSITPKLEIPPHIRLATKMAQQIA